MGNIKNNKKMLLLAILFSAGSAQVLTFGGKCPAIPLISDFSVEKYLGEWYEQLRYPDQFQNAADKCVKATYGPRDETSVTVNNTGIEPDGDLWYLSWILGQAEQTEPETHPNKLYVSFNFNPARAARRSNYNVMETDYENYSIVWSCRDNGSFTTEYVWILSRDQQFRETEMFQKVLQIAVEKYGLQTEKVIMPIHDDCTYDYVKYCNSPDAINNCLPTA